ncbi:hypothetical protein ACF0H5_007559 [Mactra antiquata]
MAMKSLSTDSRQRSTLSKPKVSFHIDLDNIDDMNSVKENDPLPIVELKPFVQKVWRREKSFASTMDRCSSVNTVKSEKSTTSKATVESKGRDTDVTSETFTEESVVMSPPPRTSQSLPSRLSERFLTFYVSTFDDFKSQKEHLNRYVGESGFRSKARLHPSVDPKNRKQIEHSVSIIPGFITRDDRTKTTLDEISDGESISRFYSCSPKAIGPDEIQKQQEIRIAGENIKQNKYKTSNGNSPTPSRIMNYSWHGASIRHGSPASMLYQNKRSQRQKRAKTPLYDHLDRTGALPSLSINATSLKSRKMSKVEDASSEDYSDYRDTFESELKHNIGGIENSLAVLSKHGAPTKVERQLSFELENNLSRFRKLKDYSPFEINPSELAKYYPPPTFNMTQGEASIRQAMASNAASNAAKRRKGFMSRENTTIKRQSKRQQFLGHPSNQYMHAVRKSYQDVEHIDSYEGLYEPYNKFTETPYPDEEPSVPFDTPRSQTESTKISTKAVETQTQDIKIETPKTPRKVDKVQSAKSSKTESQTPRTPVPPIVKDKPDSIRNDSIRNDYVKPEIKGKLAKPPAHKLQRAPKPVFEVQAVRMNPSPLQDNPIDAGGRTFITSDTIPQVTEVIS